jgi:hypothetical protein
MPSSENPMVIASFAKKAWEDLQALIADVPSCTQKMASFLTPRSLERSQQRK